MHRTKTAHLGRSAAILIAEDFAETTTVMCAIVLREAGIKVELVGATPHPVRGRHGMSIVPDNSLSHMNGESIPGLIVIPGELGCIQALTRDPRALQLVQRLMENGGFLALAPQNDADAIWPGLPIFAADHIILRGNRPINQFAHLLRDAVNAIP
jgi:putative intracellular protease/amidase